MKAPLARIVIASAIFLVLLTQIFAAPTPPPDSMTLGVNLNDSFTFVLSSLTAPLSATVFMGPGKYSGIELELQEGDTFTITITNTTMGNDIDKGYFLEVTVANTSKSIITEVPLTPGIGSVSFTNWTAWETVINSDPIGYFGPDYLNHTLSRDYAEFSLEYWASTYWNATTTMYVQLHIVYDVLTGVSVLEEAATHNFEALGFSDVAFVISRQGYVKPPPPSSTTTTTTSSGTIPPPTSSTTSGATSSATSTVATTTAAATNTTNTGTVTTTSNTTTTSTSTTRELNTFTPSSTLDRNTTNDDSETSDLPAEDESSSSEGDLQVPGFGAIISFTALIATFTVIRYKKH